MTVHRLIGSPLAAIIFSVTAGTVSAQTQKELLDELDRTIEEAESYVSAKEVRIKTIENTLHSRGVSPERQYRIYGELFDEYQPFNYGKAVETLDKQMEIAMLLGDKSKLNDVYLKEAMLNTAAGEFLEARNDLARVDTTIFTKEQEIAYCNVQQRFWFDYDENLKGADKSMLRKVAYYRERLLALADPSSSLSRYVTVRKYIDEKYFAQADFINRHSLSRMDPASHDYANLAYFQARICESLNRREEMKNWFIRSAMADIKTATKDNASLFSLADALFKDGDYARAFKYSSFSLEDAIAFDAKLRQWQISAILPAVQKSYTDIQQTHQKKTRNMLVAMYVLVFLHKSADGKLTAGPIWDFDWGVLSYNASPQARNGLVNRDSFWYARLFDDPDFKAAVKSRWNELLPQLKTIPAFIDEMEKTLQTSAELNFKMWDPAEDASQNGGVIVNGDERMTYNAAVERLKKIYEERLEIISKNL